MRPDADRQAKLLTYLAMDESLWRLIHSLPRPTRSVGSSACSLKDPSDPTRRLKGHQKHQTMTQTVAMAQD
jgi:hypothetical protein